MKMYREVENPYDLKKQRQNRNQGNLLSGSTATGARKGR